MIFIHLFKIKITKENSKLIFSFSNTIVGLICYFPIKFVLTLYECVVCGTGDVEIGTRCVDFSQAKARENYANKVFDTRDPVVIDTFTAHVSLYNIRFEIRNSLQIMTWPI